MSEKHIRKVSNMVYTPNHHIPLGQAVKISQGKYGLRVKKDKGTYEIIPIGDLLETIVQVAEAVSPSEEHAN